MITYSYDNCQISHFAIKKVDGDCKVNKDCTVSIGIFCKSCPFFEGLKAKTDWENMETRRYVICSHPDHKDDEGMRDIRHELYEQIETNALRALSY